MTIDVRKLNVQKKYAGELSFEFEPDDNLLDIPLVAFSKPVKADLHYEILEDDSVEITGTVTFTLKGACSRCLKDAEQTFTGEVDGYFVPNGGESEDYRYTNGIINLHDCLNDAVMLALPGRIVCGEACVPLEWNEK